MGKQQRKTYQNFKNGKVRTMQKNIGINFNH